MHREIKSEKVQKDIPLFYIWIKNICNCTLIGSTSKIVDATTPFFLFASFFGLLTGGGIQAGGGRRPAFCSPGLPASMDILLHGCYY